MRLLYICQYFAFPDQPASTRAYDLSKSFVAKGIDVTIITTTAFLPGIGKGERWTYLEREGLKIYVLNCTYSQSMGFTRRVFSFLQFLIYASIKVASIKGDLVLATSTPLTVGIPALIKRFWDTTPYIFEVRDVWPEVPVKMGILKNKVVNSILYNLERLIYSYAEKTVVLSEGMKSNILSRIHFKESKLVTIPNISEVSRFSNMSDISIEELLPFDVAQKKILLYCGTIGLVNGIDYIVDLAKETKEIAPNLVYCVFGSGKELEAVLDKAKQAGVLDITFFYGGKVPKDKIPSLYNLATAGSSFVIDNSILWDNSANKFFDTLASGKPIVINYEGWQADIIRENSCGYVLPSRVSKIEAEKFVRFIMDANVVLESGQRAYELACREYTLDRAVGKYINIFEYVCKH